MTLLFCGDCGLPWISFSGDDSLATDFEKPGLAPPSLPCARPTAVNFNTIGWTGFPEPLPPQQGVHHKLRPRSSPMKGKGHTATQPAGPPQHSPTPERPNAGVTMR